MTVGIFEEGLEAYRQKEFERAAELFESLLESGSQPKAASETNPSREAILLKLAATYDELEQFEAALTSLKELLELNRDSAQAWNNLAVVCQKLGRIDEARAAFEQAYRLQPENATILISLGSIALKLSDPSRALEYLKLAIELDPGHPAAHANLSLTYAVFGRLEEAEDELRLAALYGYEHADTVQEKLDIMKRLREEIITGKNSDKPGNTGAEQAAVQSEQVNFEQLSENDTAEDTETNENASPAAGEAAQVSDETELLFNLEKEMYLFAEQLYRTSSLSENTGMSIEELVARMSGLRRQIMVIRKKYGMDEIQESDVYMGKNYMEE